VSRYWKAILALAGTLTPAGLVGILALFGVHLPMAAALLACSVVGTLAVRFGPANTPARPAVASAPTTTGGTK
jgi:hypothetical protein